MELGIRRLGRWEIITSCDQRGGEDVRTGPDKTLIDVTILIIMHGVQTLGHFQEKRHNNVKTMSVTFERAGNGNKMSKLKTKLKRHL